MIRSILRWLNQYFIFFLLVAFVITCCTTLFVTILSETLNISLSAENIGTAAKLTFWNVALLSLIFTIIDSIRRKITVERPVKRITEAAEKIIHGDFSVRVAPQTKSEPMIPSAVSSTASTKWLKSWEAWKPCARTSSPTYPTK